MIQFLIKSGEPFADDWFRHVIAHGMDGAPLLVATDLSSVWMPAARVELIAGDRLTG